MQQLANVTDDYHSVNSVLFKTHRLDSIETSLYIGTVVSKTWLISQLIKANWVLGRRIFITKRNKPDSDPTKFSYIEVFCQKLTI